VVGCSSGAGAGIRRPAGLWTRRARGCPSVGMAAGFRLPGGHRGRAAGAGASRRLPDLRHGAATLAHATGADLKTVQELLGHASIVLTADTYTSVLLDLHIMTAEAVARLRGRACAIRMDLHVPTRTVEPADLGSLEVRAGRPSLIGAPGLPQIDQG
jgi:hypothetical protein